MANQGELRGERSAPKLPASLSTVARPVNHLGAIIANVNREALQALDPPTRRQLVARLQEAELATRED